jgi:argininosuccinate lyase (EC 4.3.2.1)
MKKGTKMKDILRGRLKEEEDKLFKQYTVSLDVDRWLFTADIYLDLAHVTMLGECGIIGKEDAKKILSGLLEIKRDGIKKEELEIYEDVHVAIESRLKEKIGKVGGKMHTARSRNDEVATCLRFKLRDELLETTNSLIKLREEIINFSERNFGVIIPGYTHLQHAQPVLLSHHIMAHHDAFKRDFDRLLDSYKRVNVSPLGSAAFAGTGFKIDRKRTAYLLGFDDLIENSMDAVSARDFILEALSALSILMIDVSRMAEELILWSTSEFNFIEIKDSFASTSSIMPQKKNPDALELMRARSGSLIGYLTAAFSICKSLPFSYNLDNQEVSIHIFRSVEIVKMTLNLLNRILNTLRVNEREMEKRAKEGFTVATELADTIVRETGIPFRTAHSIVGELAREGGDGDQSQILEKLDEISSEKIGERLSKIGLSEETVKSALDLRENIKRRDNLGGTSYLEVKRMIEVRKEELKKDEEKIDEMTNKLERRLRGLLEYVNLCINDG